MVVGLAFTALQVATVEADQSNGDPKVRDADEMLQAANAEDSARDTAR